MALFSKVGSVLKQSISQNSASTMLNSARYMSTKVFVGGLSFETDDSSLRDAFAEFGAVADAKVITDRETGRSRGLGFVNYYDAEFANRAVTAMDGQELQGRTIRVNIANDRPSEMQKCHCGIPAVYKTSWTYQNPGRRFVACNNYNSETNRRGCKFFRWINDGWSIDDPSIDWTKVMFYESFRENWPWIRKEMKIDEKVYSKMSIDDAEKELENLNNEQENLKN